MSDQVQQVRYVWVEDTSDRWRVLPAGTGKLCRMPRCRKPAVAALYRNNPRRPGWWHYCGDHLYGRRLAGGKLLCEVHPESDAAKRGVVSVSHETPPPLTGDFHC